MTPPPLPVSPSKGKGLIWQAQETLPNEKSTSSARSRRATLSPRGRMVTKKSLWQRPRAVLNPSTPTTPTLRRPRADRLRSSVSSFHLQGQLSGLWRARGQAGRHPVQGHILPTHRRGLLRLQNSFSHPRDNSASGNCCAFNLLELKAMAIRLTYPAHPPPGSISCASASIPYFSCTQNIAYV